MTKNYSTDIERGFSLIQSVLEKYLGDKEGKCECAPLNLKMSVKSSTIEMEEDCKVLRNKKWMKTKCMVTKDKLAFIELSFETKEIDKIKIFKACKSTCEQILKISVGETYQFFSLSTKKLIK